MGPTRTTDLDALGRPQDPETSGKISALAVDPSGTVYLGSAGGGVWKRVGSSWVPLTDDQPSLVIGSLAIDPRNAMAIYAGTGQSSSMAGYSGAGILKSIDGGATWTHIAGPFLDVMENPVGVGPGGTSSGGARIPALAVSPTDGSVLLAGVQVRAYDLSDSGVYRSTDGGINWTPVLTGNIGSTVLFDPTDGNIAYAALSYSLTTSASGIYKSTDAGRTWLRLGGGLPTANIGVTSLAISRSNPQVLYTGIADNSTYGANLLGVYKTTDGGAHWTRMDPTADYCVPFCDQDNVIAVHPSNPDIAFFGGTEVPLSRTLDGGTSIVSATGTWPTAPHGDVSAFAFSPDASTLYMGTDGGLASSTDYTTASIPTWTFLNDLAITQFYWGFDVDPGDVNYAFAGTQDNGYQIFQGDLAWPTLSGWGDGGNILYDATSDLPFLGGWSWHHESYARYIPSLTSTGIDSTESSAFLPPVAVNRSAPTVQYTGRERVYQTTDRQATWTAISPRLGGALAYVSAIAVADHDPNVVCAGTSDGHVWCTTNAGGGAAATWTDRSAGLPSRYVMKVAINHFKEYVVGVAFNGFSGVGGDSGGHVYLSTDTGATWSDITGNLPNTQVNDLLIDDDVAQLFVASDAGVFRTIDGGANWAPLATGLPHVVVTGLNMQRATRTLFAGTFGRGMWRLSSPAVSAATPPAITLKPWRLRFTAHFGGPNPAAQAFRVINPGSPVFGAAALHWTAVPITAFGGPWLAASPGAGTDAQDLLASVDVTGLAVGRYNGVVRLADPASSNGYQDLLVLLSVTDSPPTAMAGSSFSTDATMPSGAMVGLDASGSSDPDNDPLTYSWSGPFGKASGAKPTVLLPIGKSTVMLSVADPAGMSSSASLDVTVLGPEQMTTNLLANVSTLGFMQGANLLQGALEKIRSGNATAACAKLSAFANQVRAQNGKQLTTAQAAGLLAAASRVSGALGCL